MSKRGYTWITVEFEGDRFDPLKLKLQKFSFEKSQKRVPPGAVK